MRDESSNTENFFEKFGLEVATGEVEIGQTYPIYGMITKFLEEQPGNVLVELNYSIRCKMAIPDEKRIELLRERAFEPGIFVSTVTSKDQGVEVDCSTVVFGRRQQYNA
ncbi:MAG: hypothetical protein KDD53_06340 [Bdellovibrionales bacterium]|nr:hypothetical protein [Bdellovibrionales bacterium]